MRKKIQDMLRWMVFHLVPGFIFNRLTPCQTIAFQLACQELTWRQRLSIKIHLFFCHSCWVYNRQLQMLQKKLSTFYRKFSKLPPETEKHVEELEDSVIKKHCRCCPPQDTPPDKK